MWNMLHSDSQKDYQGESDFESNNFIAQKDGLYILDEYYIASGQVLPTWGTYSDIADIQVILVRHENEIASLVLSLIPIIGQFTGLIPAAEVVTWNAHLVKVGDVWKIFCERQNSSLTSSTSSPKPSPLPPKSPNVNGVIEFTATEFLQAYSSDPESTRANYFNKALQISGTVGSLGETDNVPYIALAETDNSGDQFRFYFQDKSYWARVNSLAKSQSVTIQGTWKYNSYQLDIDNCALINP
jgi:hypothetical protein